MKRFLSWWSAILLLTVCVCTSAVAEFTPPAKPINYVSDYTNLIPPSDQKQINANLRQYYEQSGNQIMIALFTTLENDEIQNASMKLAERWKVGKKGIDSGVLISVFKKEHQIRIEVGYGLEDRLTDAKSAELIQTILIPEFRSGHYVRGFNKTISAIKVILGDANAPITKNDDHSLDFILWIGEIAILIYLVLTAFLASQAYMQLGTGMLLGTIPLQIMTYFSWQVMGLAALLLFALMGQSWFLVGNLSLFYSTILSFLNAITSSSGRGGGGSWGGGGNDTPSGGGGRFGGGGASGKW